MADLAVRPLELLPEDEARLRGVVREAVSEAVKAFEERRKLYVNFRRAYKAVPENKVKNFPWPGASNVVVPLVGILTDAVVARLFRAMLGAKDFCEVKIKSKQWQQFKIPDPETGVNKTINLEAEIRDWINQFMKSSGARDRLRTLLADTALYGEGYVKPRWANETRMYHSYDAGSVVDLPVPEYSGVRWDIPAPDDVIPAPGFDEWQALPYSLHQLRLTWQELYALKGMDGYYNIDEIGKAYLGQKTGLTKDKAKERNDPRYVDTVETSHLGSIGPAQIFNLYEIVGKWPVEVREGDTVAGINFEEIILTYSLDYDIFIRKIYNPFFGKSRMMVRIPFLVVPHELHGSGVAEQAMQFQEEATTSHNQVIDSGTLANAPIVAVSPDANIGDQQEIYPGKKVVTDNPKDDVAVFHLGANSSILGAYEDKAIKYAETRVGVSPYHLGMESGDIGSRATATGTTALISEGNLKFAMSIDDIRAGIEELLYLTIQLEQQMRPEGFEWAPGRFLQFPPGDVRTSLGLTLSLTSEKINRDLEVQNLMLLMQVLNEYYMRLMQAAALISNPMFPPVHKLVATQVMEASENVIKRFVERFDIEDVDAVVPGLMDTINAAMRIANALPGLGAQGLASGGASGVPGGAPSGPGGVLPPPPQGGQPA